VRAGWIGSATGQEQRAIDRPAQAAVGAHLGDETGARPVLARLARHGRGEQGNTLQPKVGDLGKAPKAVIEVRIV
jgi:hypothetical protein